MPTDLQTEEPKKTQDAASDRKPDDKQNPDKKEEPKEEKAPPDPAKRRRAWIIAFAVLLILGAGGFYWWHEAQKYEDTDDAEIDGHLNPIASRVAGTIQAVYVEDNQYVEAGKPLVDLDPRDYEVSLAQTRAQYDQSRAQLTGERPNLPIVVTTNGTDVANAEADLANADAAVAASEHDYASAISTLRQTEAQNAKAQSDLKRYTLLLQKQEVAQSEFDQYDSTAKAQAAAVGAQAESVASLAKAIDERRAQAAQKRATLDQTVKNAPQQVAIRNANIQARVAALKQNQAQIDQNELNLQYCHIVAPVSGIVTQRSAEIGGRIAIGQQLMMLVQTSGLWVTANFKETQLRRMRPGQRVTIHVDALDKTFEGYIQGMPAASGDRTSALPPENATGNYVKVVQRLPVRILFKKEQAGLQDLRPGMSVEPMVHFE